LVAFEGVANVRAGRHLTRYTGLVLEDAPAIVGIERVVAIDVQRFRYGGSGWGWDR
jgi:hypothetical protein